jgi:hypothetical protein
MARKAKECADVLIKMYTDRKKRFILTKKEFTEISGKRKMRKKYLVSVDEYLRKHGYVLLDLHKERQIIGVLSIETIAQWDIPDMHHDTHENQFSEDNAEESDSQEKPFKLDTSF